MPIYRVSGSVTVSAETWVRADSPEAAIAEAQGRWAELAPFGLEQAGVDPFDVAVVEEADGQFVAEAATEDLNPPQVESDEEDDEP